MVLGGESASVEGRVCAVGKSQHAMEQGQQNLKPEILEYAKYVIVFTTLESESASDVLECYWLRWQIKRAFKRKKTLAQLGRLSKHDDRSARAWLTQKLIRWGAIFPPGGTRSLMGVRPTFHAARASERRA